MLTVYAKLNIIIFVSYGLIEAVIGVSHLSVKSTCKRFYIIHYNMY